MKLLRPISLLAGLLMTMAGATAQISLTPPAAQPPASPPAAKKEAPKPKAPELAPNPLEELPTPPAGMAPEKGKGRGISSWAPPVVVVVAK